MTRDQLLMNSQEFLHFLFDYECISDEEYKDKFDYISTQINEMSDEEIENFDFFKIIEIISSNYDFENREYRKGLIVKDNDKVSGTTINKVVTFNIIKVYDLYLEMNQLNTEITGKAMREIEKNENFTSHKLITISDSLFNDLTQVIEFKDLINLFVTSNFDEFQNKLNKIYEYDNSQEMFDVVSLIEHVDKNETEVCDNKYNLTMKKLKDNASKIRTQENFYSWDSKSL